MITISYKEILFGLLLYGFIMRFGMFLGLLAGLGVVVVWFVFWALAVEWASK
jgi:hypothetical protein